MFGYVRAQSGELLVRQDKLYRGVYCGLCREMGRCTGQCSRLTLSYDMVFLYLVRAALRGMTPAVKQGRCALHLLKKRPFVQSDEELRYAARVSALLCYGKLCDDLDDERGFLRLLRLAARPVLSRAKRRAELPELYERIESRLAALSELEAQKLPSVDAPADLFGRLLSDVFAYGLSGDAEKIAAEVGFRTGRWIYTVDAADDLDEDAKKGSYNPFILLYNGEIDADRRRIIEMSMRYDLTALAAALDLVDTCDLLKIAQNIVYLGMPAAASAALGIAAAGKDSPDAAEGENS